MLVAVVLVIVGLIPISRHSYDTTQPTCMFQKARPGPILLRWTFPAMICRPCERYEPCWRNVIEPGVVSGVGSFV